MIKKVKRLNTWVIKIPKPLFKVLLRTAAIFTKNPPFTADQLDALTAGDYFEGINYRDEFGVEPTTLSRAFAEAFADPTYSGVKLSR